MYSLTSFKQYQIFLLFYCLPKCPKLIHNKIQRYTNQQINDWFANKLLEYHYLPRAISSVKIKLEKLGFPEFAVYYEQSRRTPHDTNV